MSTTKLPNLVIAGVVKAGTTSLFKYLSFHPDICASSIKETCYFMRHRYGQWDPRYQDADDPHQQFQNYFCHCENQKYIMEATPGYFPGGKRVAIAMKEALGEDVKVIIGLRNPVDRLVSVWKSKQRALELPEDLSLAGYVQKCKSMPKEEKAKQENGIFASIEDGLYADYLDEWTEVFG
ncbi:MAG: sulfotransferase domain-containing protein, partial [Bacteroidota bacterium]